MEQVFLKTFINKWNSIFFNHPLLEAFSLSFIFHLLFLIFIWFCCQIHVMFVPSEPREKVLEIEFVGEEKEEKAIHKSPLRSVK